MRREPRAHTLQAVSIRRVPVLLALSGLAVLAACGTAPQGQGETPTDSRPEPSVTMKGDTALLQLPLGRSADNGEIEITFDAVTEDSRCPADVQCVWQGNASIRLTLTGGDETEQFVVSSTLEPRRVAYGGWAISLRSLAPYPGSSDPTDRSAYVATIAVVEN